MESADFLKKAVDLWVLRQKIATKQAETKALKDKVEALVDQQLANEKPTPTKSVLLDRIEAAKLRVEQKRAALEKMRESSSHRTAGIEQI